MNKICLFLGVLCSCVSALAQEAVTLPVKLVWGGVERWSINDSLYTDVILLENASYRGEHHLPYYYCEMPAEEASDCHAVVENVTFVSARSEELPLLADLSLPAEPRVETRLSRSRQELSFGISVLPFVKRDGTVLKLQSFDLKVTRTKQEGITASARSSLHTFAGRSVLSQGRFVKIRVEESGLYRLSYTELRAKDIDPGNVRIFGYGGAILNEDFSQPKHDDLPEIAVYDTGDAILFYAQGVNKWTYDETSGKFIHEVNPYSTYGYYFVTSDEVGTKKRITTRDAVELADVMDVSVFTDYAVYEKDQATLVYSGRRLYESLSSGSSTSASFSFPNKVETAPVEVRTDVAQNRSQFSMRLNGGTSQSLSSTDVTFTTTSDDLQFTITYNGSSIGYFDYIEVNVLREMIMSGSYMLMHNRRNLGGNNRYLLSAGTAVEVWDLSDPTDIRAMTLERTDSGWAFTDSAEEPKSYLAVDLSETSGIPSATLLDEVTRQNLHGMASVDMLIIAPETFKDAAEALAQAHADYDGFATAVVTPDEVYNEFSSGTPDATAYRWIAKMLYEREDIPLRYLLLFGKGSFDNRGLVSGSGSRFLLTYQSTNSIADDKESYTTDDYFGFLDDNEGLSLGSSDKLDIAIGRFPVTTEEEAWNVVNKTIGYMQSELPGAWKNQLCFVGDDGDSNIHMDQANQVAEAAKEQNGAYIINKILLDAYQQEVSASGQSYPLAKNSFENLIRSGLLYINYMGHANVNAWANENILLTSEVKNWTNQYLPLFSAGTCDFSRYDREYVCGGEELLLNAQGGGIGCFSATRSVYPSPNCSLMVKFATYLFAHAADEEIAVGDVIMQAKNAVTSDAANKLSYVYFGDPAVRLKFPNQYEVSLQEINGKAATEADTLRALSENTLKGILFDRAGAKAEQFDGTVQVVVYDKEETITCLNNDEEEITPFTYQDRPNTIFKGTAEVIGGEFSITFKLPKDIKYNYGTGRMVFTAWDASGSEGAQGYTENFVVGGSSNDSVEVSSGPEVQMYLNHQGFVSGGQVNETPVFIAHVYDENGINVSSPTPGHDIMLMLDNNQSFVLNDYYEAELGTYKEGSINYQLPQLDEGYYTLTFRVWNLYNVSTIAYLDFEVVNDLQPEVISVRCYPNPATTSTTIQVTHDRGSEIISMTLDVYDLSGKLIWTAQQNSSNLITWNLSSGGSRVAPGMYIYRVSVKTDDKITSSKANKLIVR